MLNIKNILAGLSVGIIGKVKYFDGDVRMHSSVYDTQKDIHVPIPMIGVGAKIGFLANILEARVKITGMSYSGSFFYDGLADISFTPFPFLNIHGGYRAMSVKIDNVSDIYAKMDFYGPYAGLASAFNTKRLSNPYLDNNCLNTYINSELYITFCGVLCPFTLIRHKCPWQKKHLTMPKNWYRITSG